MPHEQMNEKQLADYLHLDLREVRKLAARGKIPRRKGEELSALLLAREQAVAGQEGE